MPHLLELQACLGHVDAEESKAAIDSIAKIFTQSPCSLDKLTICGKPQATDAAKLLEITPNISILHLSIEDRNYRDPILARLVCQRVDRQCLLSNLRILNFDTIYPSDLWAIIDVVRSRLPKSTKNEISVISGSHCKRLTTISLWYKCSGWDEDLHLIGILKGWQDLGLLRLNSNWLNKPQR
ncbi:hypothetical protein M422DRAFT_784880 [Sphaerobolus stellatus SS14]|uniref:Uncharacterized protein n=1 Tax=Sphaerobolus stellatus (strain SS14) TaxID=990650 RepID=A0A0C9UES5_SPHS4|nr:hypothetical protein M422DRAFT_784880 [Sphaerobolus stellatus SS14]